MRDTNQKVIESLAEENPDLVRLCVALLIQALERISPTMVVVASTGAARMPIQFGDTTFPSIDALDLGLGTPLLKNPANTPVLYTSMLSGQRALDSGGRARLAWHMKGVNAAIRPAGKPQYNA